MLAKTSTRNAQCLRDAMNRFRLTNLEFITLLESLYHFFGQRWLQMEQVGLFIFHQGTDRDTYFIKVFYVSIPVRRATTLAISSEVSLSLSRPLSTFLSLSLTFFSSSGMTLYLISLACSNLPSCKSVSNSRCLCSNSTLDSLNSLMACFWSFQVYVCSDRRGVDIPS